uniref:Uncharacterized protein n=1 Tax=Anguilla anguilla TaxID=7936 RepID=A0A0E9STZ3_ANGAN
MQGRKPYLCRCLKVLLFKFLRKKEYIYMAAIHSLPLELSFVGDITRAK